MTTQTATVVPLPVERKPDPPKEVRRPKWTAARRAKFQRTMRRKAKERIRAAREERRKVRQGSKALGPIARQRGAHAARQASAALTGPHTGPQDRRTGRTAGEERSDAIVYLRAAAERTALLSNAELLAALALRRLEGRIK